MPSGPYSVLVVDDHPVVREALADVIEATDGLSVWGTAASGDDALAQLEATGPARADGPGVVVTDVRMPGMTGLELVAEVRSRWPALPCLVFSAQQSGTFAARARAAGAAGFVEKGDPTALIEAVLRVSVGAA